MDVSFVQVIVICGNNELLYLLQDADVMSGIFRKSENFVDDNV